MARLASSDNSSRGSYSSGHSSGSSYSYTPYVYVPQFTFTPPKPKLWQRTWFIVAAAATVVTGIVVTCCIAFA